MNKIISTGVFAFSIYVIIGLCGCKKFVQVDLPDTQIGSTAVFETEASVKAAVANMYAQLNNSSSFASGNRQSVSFLQGLTADELIAFSSPAEPYYLNNLLPSDETVSSTWNQLYNVIYAANSIIEGLQNSTAI